MVLAKERFTFLFIILKVNDFFVVGVSELAGSIPRSGRDCMWGE